MFWGTYILLCAAAAWLCLAICVWCIIRTGTVADRSVLHYYRCKPAETDAVLVCRQIRALAARADAGAIFAAVVGNALTVAADATRGTLLRELDKWASGKLTNR